MDNTVCDKLPDYRYFDELPVAVKDALESRITKDEVKAALDSMASLKAPGKDGLHAKFFQSQWNIVGDSVYKMVLEAFEGKPLDLTINNTLLVHLPKVDKPKAVSQYKSISLCSMVYKIITKIIVRKLKFVMPLLVAPNQVSFFIGRFIIDNVLVTQEVIHSMRSDRRKPQWMAIKVDFEKAYNRII